MEKKEINTPYILNKCQLSHFPNRVAGIYLETDFIEPHWCGDNSPLCRMISKPYVLTYENNDTNEEIRTF